jgi:mono/diheme cytochrome c family protein
MKKKSGPTEFLRIITIAIFLLISSNISHAQSSAWHVPSSAVNIKNPVASIEASIKNGKTLYKSYCTPCHGDKGKGDGPASASLNPKPADHTSQAFQAETDGSIYYKISEGEAHTAMPPFKATLKADQRWAIVNYIRTLGKTKH